MVIETFLIRNIHKIRHTYAYGLFKDKLELNSKKVELDRCKKICLWSIFLFCT